MFCNIERKNLSKSNIDRWQKTKIGYNPVSKTGNTFGFLFRIDNSKVVPTILSGQTFIAMQDEPKDAHWKEYLLCGSYPFDYNFKTIEPKYLIGMSVPPVMTAQIATKINEQWFR